MPQLVNVYYILEQAFVRSRRVETPNNLYHKSDAVPANCNVSACASLSPFAFRFLFPHQKRNDGALCKAHLNRFTLFSLFWFSSRRHDDDISVTYDFPLHVCIPKAVIDCLNRFW